MNERILITGGNGQLGRSLIRRFPHAAAVVAYGREECDVRNRDSVRKAIQRSGASVIIHCAAMTDVDRAEQYPSDAAEANIVGTIAVASEAAAFGIYLVHVSTDYVFDGEKSTPYDETDKLNPINQYGKTKQLAELAVADSGAEAAVIRTGWMYGSHGKNMVQSLISRLQSDDRAELPVVTDQFGSPTWVDDIADQIIAIMPHRLRGTYHCAASGGASRYQLAVLLNELCNGDLPLRAARSDEFPRPARRPLCTPLNCDKLQATGCSTLPPWEESLAKFVQSLKDGNVQVSN